MIRKGWRLKELTIMHPRSQGITGILRLLLRVRYAYLQELQYLSGQPAGQEIVLSPGIVSPDNDGQDDYATIDYTLPAPGYLMNITFFDASGRPVRYLQRNALCGSKGSFRWDGLGEKNQQLATGIYVMSTEIFNLKGGPLAV
jgi:hypothetical protein